MERRTFLGVPLLFLGAPQKVKAHESEYGLGNYQSHMVVFDTGRDFTEWGYEIGFKYVNFPIEHLLYIDYDKGREVYYTYNCPKDLLKKINQMSPEELMRCRVSCEENASTKWISMFKFDNQLFKIQCTIGK